MRRIEWTSQLTLGIEPIDEQHRRLIAIVNQYADAVRARLGAAEYRSLLQTLQEAALSHFHDEEAYMDSIGYPNREAHAEVHARLARQLGDMCHAARQDHYGETEEFLSFLKNWLLRHVLHEDLDIAVFQRRPQDG